MTHESDKSLREKVVQKSEKEASTSDNGEKHKLLDCKMKIQLVKQY